MDLWKVLLLCFATGLLYVTYIFGKRAWSEPKRGKVKPILNLVSKKHWPPGENVSLTDDGTFSANIFRVAGNTFGDYANRSCTANLIPETNDEGKRVVSVFIDGLRVGCLSDRHALSFHVALHQAGLDTSITSCDAHIGGGGTGIDGKKLPYSIMLHISWFGVSEH